MTTPQPAPIVVDDVWTLAPARPDRLERVAQARRKQSAKLTGASNELIFETAKVCGQSWSGMTASNAKTLRGKIANHVDDLAASAKAVADVLDRVAAKQRAAGNALKNSLLPVGMAGVGIQSSGGKIVFTSRDDAGAGAGKVAEAMAEAADIRADLDAYLIAAAADLKRINTGLCRVSAWASSAEERRWSDNQGKAGKLIASGGLNDNVKQFQDALKAAKTPDEVRALVKEHGEKLWKEAAERARDDFERYETAVENKLPFPLRPGDGAKTDDRPLYWARLEMESAVRDWARAKGIDEAGREDMISSLDQASRGMTTSGFDPGVKRIFVTGFDPFGFGSDINGTHNPSGAAAMALDGAEFTVNGEKYQIQSAMIPVRHQEFRDGTVQGVIDGVLRDPHPPVAFITLSLDGNATAIELEETYGNAFTPHAPDNNNVNNGGRMPGVSDIETLSTNLPAAKLYGAGVPFSFDTHQVSGGEGTGGDYFSNALPRMVAESRDQHAASVLTGHLHVPGYAAPSNGITSPSFELNRLSGIRNVKALIEATVQ